MTAEGVPAARRRPNREAEYFCKLGWTWFLVICPSGKSPSSFRGARSANPESITTDACCQRHGGPGFAPHQRSWLWIPGPRQAAHPGMTRVGSFRDGVLHLSPCKPEARCALPSYKLISVVMDSGPAPSGASRNDEGRQLSRWRTTSISLRAGNTARSILA